MSIDEQPMNVYWSGKRTETVNRSKINYKGSVATFSDLPDTNNQTGDMYSITGLNGENYIWNGTAWDALGTSDANVVHKTGNETLSGEKSFTGTVFHIAEDIDKTQTPETALYAYPVKWLDGADAELCSFYLKFDTLKNLGVSLVIQGTNTKKPTFSLNALSNNDTSAMFGNCDSVRPATTNATNLGTAAAAWSQVYAETTEISTSDARQKTSPQPIPDDVLDAWESLSFVQFKLLESVNAKGEAARFHAGLIAQDVAVTFADHDLDPSLYGFFCHDEWESESGEAGDAYALRYVEALCMEAACQRRRADRLEARIAMLEEKLK